MNELKLMKEEKMMIQDRSQGAIAETDAKDLQWKKWWKN